MAARIRLPACAGRFYPADAVALRERTAALLDLAVPVHAPVAVVAPHAGYVYSGATAGYAFAACATKAPRRVVLLGPSHYHRFPGAEVYSGDAMRTPLGDLPIDTDLSREVAALFGGGCPSAHENEHAIEVELPFIQARWGALPVVAVLFGEPAGVAHAEVGERLAALLDAEDLVVASSDLSHFLSEPAANAIDAHTLEIICAGDPLRLAVHNAEGRASLCGSAAVSVAMGYARARGRSVHHVVDYRTSAAASGDFTRVVGYGGVALGVSDLSV